MVFGVEVEDSRHKTVQLSHTLTPALRQDVSLWHDGELDLANLAAGPAKVRFTASATGSNDDVAAFGAPLVVERIADPRPSIILISLDTLRADRLAADRKTSLAPRMREFAEFVRRAQLDTP